MSTQVNSNKIPPLYDTLMGLKDETLAGLRCCLIGRIAAVYSSTGATNTVDVAVNWLQMYQDGTTGPYPQINGCPVVTLQGSGVVLGMPIKVGDECLVFVADRCIDSWYSTGSAQTLPNLRMHDMSDGFALVGVNSIPHKLVTLLSTTEGGIADLTAKFALNAATSKFTMQNLGGANNLLTILQGLVTAINAIVTSGGQTVNPASQTALTAISTQLATLLY